MAVNQPTANAEANVPSPNYPAGWWFYWCLRTSDYQPYTLDEAVTYMKDESDTFSADWQDLSREQVRKLEVIYMRERHPAYKG